MCTKSWNSTPRSCSATVHVWAPERGNLMIISVLTLMSQSRDFGYPKYPHNRVFVLRVRSRISHFLGSNSKLRLTNSCRSLNVVSITLQASLYRGYRWIFDDIYILTCLDSSYMQNKANHIPWDNQSVWSTIRDEFQMILNAKKPTSPHIAHIPSILGTYDMCDEVGFWALYTLEV